MGVQLDGKTRGEEGHWKYGQNDRAAGDTSEDSRGQVSGDTAGGRQSG